MVDSPCTAGQNTGAQDYPGMYHLGAAANNVTDQNITRAALEKQVERAEAVARLAATLNEEPDTQRIVDVVCEAAVSALKADLSVFASFGEQNSACEVLKVFASFPNPTFISGSLLAKSVDHQIVVDGAPVYIEDLQEMIAASGMQPEAGPLLRSVLAATLFNQGKRFGLLAVISIHEVRLFNAEEMTLLQTFADLVSSAMMHARLYEAARRQAQVQKLISQITQMAMVSGDLKGMLDLLARRVAEMPHVHGCYIALWDAVKDVPLPFAGFGQSLQNFFDVVPEEREKEISRAAVQLERAILLSDLSDRGMISERLAKRFRGDAILALPLLVRGQKYGAILLEYYQPHPPILEDEVAAWDDMAAQISLAISNVLDNGQEKQRLKESEILYQSISMLNSSLELQKVMDTILSSLRDVVPYDSAVIFFFEENRLRVMAQKGEVPHSKRIGAEVEKTAGLFSLLEGKFEPVILSDAQQHSSYEQWSDPSQDRIHGWMGVPLIAYHRSIGYLALNSQQAGVYTSAHAHLALALASQAAVAIENARLFEQVRAGRERLQTLSKKLVEVQEAERRFIAYELHDEIGQVLTGLQITLEMGKRLDGQQRLDTITEAQEIVRALMSQVRDLSLDLRPAMLDDLGLVPALQWHFKRYEEKTGIRVNFSVDNFTDRFPSDIEVVSYRIIQEALTNVARYAGVSHVDVRLSAGSAGLTLVVEDRGQGFDLKAMNRESAAFGLTAIRERTYLAGGKVDVLSWPGEGTRITAVLPAVKRLERRRNDHKSNSGR